MHGGSVPRAADHRPGLGICISSRKSRQRTGPSDRLDGGSHAMARKVAVAGRPHGAGGWNASGSSGHRGTRRHRSALRRTRRRPRFAPHRRQPILGRKSRGPRASRRTTDARRDRGGRGQRADTVFQGGAGLFERGPGLRPQRLPNGPVHPRENNHRPDQRRRPRSFR